MLWILLGLGAALFDAIKQALSKKLLQKLNPYVVAWYASFISLFILIPINLFKGIPLISSKFFLYLLIVGIINTLTTVLIMKALQQSELSLVSPLFSLSPALVLVSAMFFLNEIPTLFGIGGVCLIVAGSIIINIKEKTNPFQNILKDKGQHLIIIATLLWAISSNFYKLGMQTTTPLFFIMSVYSFITIILLPAIITQRIKPTKELILIGISGSLVSILQWTAASITMLVYALSIKRISSIISILFGKKFFQEKNMTWKLTGAIIMLIGVSLIIIFG